VSKALTLSPGLRYELQTHVDDHLNFAPRIGVTWSPFKSGKTSLRGSWGIFYDWLPTGTYEQVLRVDGYRQQELNIIDPTYPNPTGSENVTATNRYLLADELPMSQAQRVSVGVQHAIKKWFNVGAGYVYGEGTNLLIGQNLNAPVDGVRPDPTFANVIRAVPGGRSTQENIAGNLSLSVPSPPGAANSPTAPKFVWKRGLGVYLYASYNRSENNTDGAFAVPFDPTLATEWGPISADFRRRTSLSLSSGAIKNFFGQISMTANGGVPINIRTGQDDNADLLFNDRPIGYSRNSARGAGQLNVNGYFNYTFGFGRQQIPTQPGIMITGGPGGLTATTMAAQAAPRYRVNLSVNIENLTNHANYIGYNSAISSALFLQPTAIQGVRRITFSMGINF
jgi:hypothetical protein